MRVSDGVNSPFWICHRRRPRPSVVSTYVPEQPGGRLVLQLYSSGKTAPLTLLPEVVAKALEVEAGGRGDEVAGWAVPSHE